MADENNVDVTNTAPEYGTEIVTVRSPQEVLTRQKLPYFLGISRNTTGAKGLSMNLVVIPPGASAEPHYHKDFETGIYVLKGRVETRYGAKLEKSVVNEAGDFLFIPPGLPHQPFNLSDSETAVGVVVRNDPNEQENVVPYNPE
jgi:uncharacterized RmlC-like cupin family protein